MTATTEPSLGELLGEIFLTAEKQVEKDRVDCAARYHSAVELSRQVAPLLGVDDTEVFWCLTGVPDNLLDLLSSPQGWITLSGYAAARLGADLPVYRPVVH